MAKIFWDTNLFIYLLEDKSELGEKVVRLRRAMLARADQLYTSALTVGEILIKPVGRARRDVAEQYQAFFRRPAITVVPFDLAAAGSYGRIRQDRSIAPPDAIQLACAAAAGIDLFITNDYRLCKKIVAGIHFITSLDRVPF